MKYITAEMIIAIFERKNFNRFLIDTLPRSKRRILYSRQLYYVNPDNSIALRNRSGDILNIVFLQEYQQRVGGGRAGKFADNKRYKWV